MNNEKIDTTTVFSLFEEIKEQISDLVVPNKQTEEIESSEDIEIIKTSLSEIGNTLQLIEKRDAKKLDVEKQDAEFIENQKLIKKQIIASQQSIIERLDTITTSPKNEDKKIHVHRFDIKSNKLLLFVMGLSFAFLGSVIYNGKQYSINKSLENNDLKYRYLKMRGEAIATDIKTLESIFHHQPNKKEISKIKKDVEEYEQLLKEEAEITAKARFNERESQRLRKEAEERNKAKEKKKKEPRGFPVRNGEQ